MVLLLSERALLLKLLTKTRITLPKLFTCTDSRNLCVRIEWHNLVCGERSNALRELVALQFKQAEKEKKKIPTLMDGVATSIVQQANTNTTGPSSVHII